MSQTRRTILLVEDNEHDVFLLRRALVKARVDCWLQVVVDGQDALDYLAGASAYADRARFPMPILVFLDLTLPRVHGLDVLAWARLQPELVGLSFVILSSSEAAHDRRRAAALGARAYLVKPASAETIARAGLLDDRDSGPVEEERREA